MFECDKLRTRNLFWLGLVELLDMKPAEIAAHEGRAESTVREAIADARTYSGRLKAQSRPTGPHRLQTLASARARRLRRPPEDGG